jgi:hypothetical protein
MAFAPNALPHPAGMVVFVPAILIIISLEVFAPNAHQTLLGAVVHVYAFRDIT